MTSSRIEAALERAQDDARTLPPFPREDGIQRRRRLAVGDPQAFIETFLAILDGHDLLGADGRLAPDVQLVSMGDHFDFGGAEERDRKAQSGTALLAWLAAHPADQVIILAGNHDLARVGELVRFDDAEFARAQEEADLGYYTKEPARPEVAFRARYGLPSWEVVARDFGSFRVEQRTLVAAVLQTRRMRAAFAAAPDLVLCHAGVTHDELDAIGVPAAAQSNAEEVARALNDALDAAVSAWKSGPLTFAPLHEPGDASREGRGIFYHRPVRVAEGDSPEPIPRRRFDVRRLPTGLTQAIGHIRDKKCRQLLGESVSEQKGGVLRSLLVKEGQILYAHGVPSSVDAERSTMLFLDGGMSSVAPHEYELLDLVGARAGNAPVEGRVGVESPARAMQLHPTRATFHVALAGATLVAVGVAARMAPVVAFGGAMVLAIGVGRAIARAAVTRLRAAGFEMLWNAPRRVARTARGGEVVLQAELRNRGVDDARAVTIRAVSSSWLEAKVHPSLVDLPASTTIAVSVTVRAKRVGRWGLHGMALEVRGMPAGGEGLYEVPLMFSNPFGIEVFPRALYAMLQSPRGGRSRRAAEAGRPAALAGEGDELRELREHVPGDPFKRIAWKASARRGLLVVREMEREERDVVWFVLDASVELWAGGEGRAPLDEGVDEIAALSARHLQRGDHVGLIVTASRLRTWLSPAGGAAHASRVAAALASAANTVDADRCELDEYEVAQRVAEHARPLDSRGLADLPKSNLDMLAARAEMLRARAPFAPRLPYGRTSRERTLRHYLASFGIEVPPRADGEHERTLLALTTALDRLRAEKQRPSIVHIWAPPPPLESSVVAAVRKLRARRVEVRWSVPSFESSVGERPADPAGDDGDATDVPRVAELVSAAVEEAVRIRARATRARGEHVLRRMGVVRVTRRPLSALGPSVAVETDPGNRTA